MDDEFAEERLWDGYAPDPTLHEYDQHVERMLLTLDQTDARAWFSKSSHSPRRIAEFGQEESQRIVESVYARGANDVRVLGDSETIKNGGSVDMLLVVLPPDTEGRLQLFELSETVAEESGLMGDIDEGQKFMVLRWE